MTKLGSNFVSDDPDFRGTPGIKGDTGDTGPVGDVPLTTKGDLMTFDTADARLGVGSNGQVLEADSTESLGVKWATPAAGGALNIKLRTTSSGALFSTSAFATKGCSYACINSLTVKAIQVPTNTDASATYKLVIAEVSGASDTIDVITATSTTSAVSAAVLVTYDFIFASPVALVAGKRYAFLMVRTDGSGTAINRVSFPATEISSSNLEYVGSARIASNNPVVTDNVRFDTANVTDMTITFSVD